MGGRSSQVFRSKRCCRCLRQSESTPNSSRPGPGTGTAPRRSPPVLRAMRQPTASRFTACRSVGRKISSSIMRSSSRTGPPIISRSRCAARSGWFGLAATIATIGIYASCRVPRSTDCSPIKDCDRGWRVPWPTTPSRMNSPTAPKRRSPISIRHSLREVFPAGSISRSLADKALRSRLWLA